MTENWCWSPKILPGVLHDANRNACDWGWQGLLAYGCQSYVVVIDPKTVQAIQTVHHSSSLICQVKWAQENYYHDQHTSYCLRLAAGDVSGTITIWDIHKGVALNELVESNRVPLSLEWLKGYDVSQDLLLILYSHNTMVLWNADTGVKLWHKTFQDNIMSMVIDPFNNSNMIVMNNEWVMLVTDLDISKVPSEKGKKIYIHSNSIAPTNGNGGNSTPIKRPASKSTFQKVITWAEDLRGKIEEDFNNSCDCLQVTYLPLQRNHALLLFPQEILILDIEIGQAIGSLSIESNSPLFQSVVPCHQRDVLYLLHENGSISVRVVHSPDHVPYQKENEDERLCDDTYNVVYDMKCHSDSFRLSRNSRMFGFCVDPVLECNSCIILSDGRILLWSLAKPCDGNGQPKPLPGLQCPDVLSLNNNFLKLEDMFPLLLSFGTNFGTNVYHPPKFLLGGVFESVALNPVCFRMCPPMTTKNFKEYKPYLAIGCVNGVLQVFNVSYGCLVRTYSMQCQKIKGIEWINLTSMLVYFAGSSTGNKSEIAYLDIVAGGMRTLPGSNGMKHSTIASLKVSRMKQYFLVLYCNRAAELWDVVNLCQLRDFPQKFPHITAFEWSPITYKLAKKKTDTSAPVVASSEDISPPRESLNMLEASPPESSSTSSVHNNAKEHLVFSDNNGTVYHYVVEGTSLKNGSKVPPETGMGAVSYVAWKGDMLTLGDVDGNINFWDLKAKISRVCITHRGAIRRLKFAPGKGNMLVLVLFTDGVDIWDAAEAKMISTIKTPKEQVGIIDADWLSSTLPLFLLSNGSIRILESSLKSENCAISEKSFAEAVFNPRLLNNESLLKMKHFLQHQKWRKQYNASSFSKSGEEKRPDLQTMLNTMPSDVASALNDCPMGTAERCMKISLIYGDESDWMFWKVALHYLNEERERTECPLHSQKVQSSINSLSSSFDDLLLEDDIARENVTQAVCECTPASLDTSFDVLCNNDFYKKTQLYSIGLLDSHRTSYDHTRICAKKLILSGQTDRAVQMLLESEPNESNYYLDALRACLIATVSSSGASQSTIKLVATNLIASGKITEGVELLCLVDKGIDACRYLQTYGEWQLAVWLAKVRLNREDCAEVIVRWSDKLSSLQLESKTLTIAILLSVGRFVRALEMMFSIGQIERAVLFLEACMEFQVLSPQDHVHSALIENIYLDYARLQIKLNNLHSAKYYCGLAGGRGRKLLEDIHVTLVDID